MRKVITIPETTGEEKESKSVDFTHLLSVNIGWEETSITPKDYEKIVYLGKCRIDGDMFAAYDDDSIDIYKGHLNNGTY